MRTIIFVAILLFALPVYAQNPDRHVIYPPMFNPYTGSYNPGLSVYSNGTYSMDSFAGSHSYHYGYRPAYTNRRRYRSRSGYYNPYGYGYPYNYNAALSPYHPFWW